MQLQDVYKLLYQGCLGVGHLLSNEQEALTSLQQELSQMAGGIEGELLWEAISPDDAVGRVNLRPFKERGLDGEALSRGLLAFAFSPPGDVHMLARNWSIVGSLIEGAELGFDMKDYRRLTACILEGNYPAMHHSRAYSDAYHPAYRILSGEIFRSLFPACR